MCDFSNEPSEDLISEDSVLVVVGEPCLQSLIGEDESSVCGAEDEELILFRFGSDVFGVC